MIVPLIELYNKETLSGLVGFFILMFGITGQVLITIFLAESRHFKLTIIFSFSTCIFLTVLTTGITYADNWVFFSILTGLFVFFLFPNLSII